jgi:hypothetical protein
MVRGLIQQQQIGFLPGDNGKRYPGLLTARKRANGRKCFVAVKIEAAQEVPDFLLRCGWRKTLQVQDQSPLQ